MFVQIFLVSFQKKEANEPDQTIVRQSKKFTANETNFDKILQNPKCLDEAAITINFITRRLFCNMFDLPIFRELVQTKIEMKLKQNCCNLIRKDKLKKIFCLSIEIHWKKSCLVLHFDV